MSYTKFHIIFHCIEEKNHWKLQNQCFTSPYLCTSFSYHVTPSFQKYSIETINKNIMVLSSTQEIWFCCWYLFNSMKCRINYRQLPTSREYFFSILFRIHPDVTYYDLVVLLLLRLTTLNYNFTTFCIICIQSHFKRIGKHIHC